MFPLSDVKGREEAGKRVTGLTSHLITHTSADNSSGASRDEMENIMQKDGWKAKSSAVMDRINKWRQSVITKLTRGVERWEAPRLALCTCCLLCRRKEGKVKGKEIITTTAQTHHLNMFSCECLTARHFTEESC